MIDYLGAGVLAAALSAIVLVASLGGTTWAWGAPHTILVAAAGVVLLGVFGLVERRAAEPVLPLQLLRDRVFAVAGGLSLIVGFALFGSVTFLPLYFQTVDAATPSAAGLRLTPMMVGLLVMSITSGQLISRRGRYRIFPIVGTALMALGLFLLSRLDVGTSTITSVIYLLILGLGLGSTMQVLVLAVQNAVSFEVLGAATSGVTLFRGIGGSLGAAVFGTIFSSRLASGLRGPAERSHRPPGRRRCDGSPARRWRVSPGRPIRLRARLCPRAESRVRRRGRRRAARVRAQLAAPGTAAEGDRGEQPGLEDSLAAPRSPDSLAEIERALSCAVSPEVRRRFRERVADPRRRRSHAGRDLGARPHQRARRGAGSRARGPGRRSGGSGRGGHRGAPPAEPARRRRLPADSRRRAARSPSAPSPPVASCCARRSTTPRRSVIRGSTNCCDAWPQQLTGEPPVAQPELAGVR